MYFCDNHIIYKLFAFKIEHRDANIQPSGFAPKTWCQTNYANDAGLYTFLIEYYLYCSTLILMNLLNKYIKYLKIVIF